MFLLDSLVGTNLVLATTGLSPFFMRAFLLRPAHRARAGGQSDGASELQIFLRVMLPLVSSGMGALAVFTFVQNWNNFLVPLLYLPGGSFRPLTTGLYVFVGGRSIDIGPLAAGTLITIIPGHCALVALQRQVTEGFLPGAVKG